MTKRSSLTRFGQELRRLRLAAGLSQEELAERAGVSARGVSDLERGLRSLPRPETVRLLADALALDPSERRALIAAARPELATPPAAVEPTPPPPSPTVAASQPSSQAPRPPNLPVPPTRLVGREREVAELVMLLRREAVRLLTLTGPGGVGKTRMALATAWELAGDPAIGSERDPTDGRGQAFADGVVWVDLAPIREPGLVVSAVARACEVREEAGRPIAETLRAALAGRQVLLVLDNCEQVLPAAVDVATWLAAAPGLKVLATSRERLHLRGERVISLDPLAVPPTGQRSSPPIEGLAGIAAVRLFVERAEESRHGFALSEANAETIAEIVRRLDGLPLAIELAAARIRSLSPAALLDQLARRLPVLTDGPRDLPDRHHTLLAAIAWSHDLLRTDERALFRRLAPFAGGCTLEAADFVGGKGARGQGGEEGGGEGARRQGEEADSVLAPSVFAALASLADKSLVRRVDGADGETRYVMLETVREFALDRLDESGEAAMVGRAHAAYFRALAETAGPELKGPEQVRWLTRLEVEHDNMRAALAWTLDHGDEETGLRLAAELSAFWYAHSHLSEGREWLKRFLGQDKGTPAVRAAALGGAAALARAQADHARAAVLADEAIAIARALDDRARLGSSLYVRGAIAQAQGEADVAARLLEEALRIARELHLPSRIASVLNVLSDVASARGETARAIELMDEALAMKRAIGDTSGVSVCLNNLGVLLLEQGNLDRADALFAESLALSRELGDRAGIALALNNLGAVARDRGDLGRAIPLLAEALTLFVEVGDRSGIAYGLEGVADVAVKQGAHRRGTRLYAAAHALRETIGEPLPPEQRAGYTESFERARAAIGPEVFAAAWAAGAALSLDEAVALAMTTEATAPVTSER